MKRLLLAAIAGIAALSAASCPAWTLNIRDGSLKYEARELGNEIQYKVNGKLAGTARKLGDETVYRDAQGQHAGSVRKLGNEWVFKDKNGKAIGSAVFYGEELTYKDARGRHTGTAKVFAGKTQYKNGRGVDIGSADTDKMPLRPIPLENLMAGNNEPAACMTVIASVSLEAPGARAGLRAGDIIIGMAGSEKTLFDFPNGSCPKVHQSMAAQINKAKETEGSQLIIYRPAAGEKSKVSGRILKTAPMPKGSRGFIYNTADNGPSFTRKDSLKYIGELKKLYESGSPEDAEIKVPDPAAFAKDTRDIPEAHQEFREVLVNGKAVTGWFWISDNTGRLMSPEDIRSRQERALKENQPKVLIKSYPGAKIFVSAVADSGEGDPALNSKFTYIGVTDMSGVFHYSGKEEYTLPLNARCLAFSASVVDMDMNEVMQDPMITSLPANTKPAVRDAMIQQVITIRSAQRGIRPELKSGYVRIDAGKKEYPLK